MCTYVRLIIIVLLCFNIAITLLIDRRKTLGDLKQMLEEIVLVPSTEFRVQCHYVDFCCTIF